MALSSDRNTARRAGDQFEDPVGAGETIFAGGLVVLNATGYAAAASTATGLTARGVAEARVDNAGGADGDLSVPVRTGVFRFDNSGADPVDRTHIGGDAYIVDDETVAATDGGATRSVAGRIEDVDNDGVWVHVG